MLVHFAPVLLAALLSSSPTLPQDGPALGPDGLPVAPSGLVISVGEDLPLADLLVAYSQATGVRVLMDQGVRQTVEATSLGGFGQAWSVPGDELQGLVEGLLVRSGLRLVMTHPGRVPVLSLISEGSHRGNMDLPWLQVEVEAIAYFADNQALLVETVVGCVDSDARQVANSLRPTVSYPWTQVIAMGTEQAILLRGTGTEVARLVRAIRSMDALGAAARQRALTRQQEADAAVLMEVARVEPAASPAEAPVASTFSVRTELVEAPDLPTPELGMQAFQLSAHMTDIVGVVTDLAMGRHSAENAHRVWHRTGAGEELLWPRPKFVLLPDRGEPTRDAGGQLLVQAAPEDLAWITATLELVAGLREAPVETR